MTNPVQFDETPATLRRAPQFSEHGEEILRELGRTDDEIIQLKLDRRRYLKRCEPLRV